MTTIKQAMIMAAGLGTRLRPITNHIPKPMIQIAHKTFIQRILEQLYRNNIISVVINLHHKADLLKDYVNSLEVAQRLNIIFSYEAELLEAGGIVKVLHYFAEKPFYVINSDMLWIDNDNEPSVLESLSNNFDNDKMDSLLLLQQTKRIPYYQGRGDLHLAEGGSVYRADKAYDHPYVFCGIQIMSPNLLKGLEVKNFKLFKDFIFKAKKADDGKLDRIYGIETSHFWLHISTEEELNLVRRYLQNKEMTFLKNVV
ncbi:Nucleotidyltransferase family protein [Rickettsiales bacterium Ac37b]|nr:Nucleotidyltransferase family protein [Rickettsiales bacterium Ac37b]